MSTSVIRWISCSSFYFIISFCAVYVLFLHLLCIFLGFVKFLSKLIYFRSQFLREFLGENMQVMFLGISQEIVSYFSINFVCQCEIWSLVTLNLRQFWCAHVYFTFLSLYHVNEMTSDSLLCFIMILLVGSSWKTVT